MLAERTSQQVIDLLFGLRESRAGQVDVQLVAQPVTATATPVGAGRVSVEVWTVSVFLAEGDVAGAGAVVDDPARHGRRRRPVAGRRLGDVRRPVAGAGAGGRVRFGRRGGARRWRGRRPVEVGAG